MPIVRRSLKGLAAPALPHRLVASTWVLISADSFDTMPIESRLRVAVEATSLLGPRTGVGTMTDALLTRMAATGDMDLTGVLISFRGRGLLGAMLPDGVDTAAVAFPARLAHRLWQRLDRPTVAGYDVVHGPNFVVPPAAGGAELVTIHDFGPWHFPDLVSSHARAYPRLVERAVGRGADVHVVSDFVADEAAEILGLAPERIHVIHNGFEPAATTGDPRAGRSMAGGPYVLSIGTVEPRKDLLSLVAAMALLWDEHPDLRLVVAGADGGGSAAFDAAVEGLGATKASRVLRLGYVSDAERSDLLSGAVCLAFPSVYEGFGLPPLEAMAQDTPVVATTAGSLPEICGDGAVLVKPRDPQALADAIDSLMVEGPESTRVAELVERGRARLGYFSWDSAAEEMALLYRNLADGQR